MMFKKFRYLFENSYINTAGLLALPSSVGADALGGGNWFWALFALLLLLILFGIIDELRKNKKLSTETIHIPIVIKVDDGPDTKYVLNNLVEQIEKQNHLSNYEEILNKYFSINIETCIFEYKGSIYEFDRLLSFARIIRYKINQIEKQLNNKVKFHIAYYKRPSVGFLLGTIFRTEAVVIYQNNDFENSFYPVAKIDSRGYKEKIDKFKNYEITENISNTNKDLLVIIESASHNIAVKSSSLKQYENVIKIKLKEKGTIDYNTSWNDYATEIYNILNNTQITFNHITIAHAMPEAISIILGMALENYWNIDITQYENGDYKFVLNMQNIKYYD